MDGLRGYFSVCIPGRFQCGYLKMLGVGIDLKGILKLLTNLKPNKAPGLDGVGPMVLKEIGEEVALVVQLLFQRSVSAGDSASCRPVS